MWKLNHYYERLDDWYADQGVAPNPFLPPAAEPEWELHNLTTDPDERQNRVSTALRPCRLCSRFWSCSGTPNA